MRSLLVFSVISITILITLRCVELVMTIVKTAPFVELLDHFRSEQEIICPRDIPGVYVEAVSGDLVLRAPSGRVRIEGQNVDINASGFDGENGVIDLSANEKIILDAGQTVDIKGKVSCKIFSEGTVDVIGRQVMNIYGGMIDCADGASTSKTSLGSKGGSANEIKNKITV